MTQPVLSQAEIGLSLERVGCVLGRKSLLWPVLWALHYPIFCTVKWHGWKSACRARGRSGIKETSAIVVPAAGQGARGLVQCCGGQVMR